MLPADATPAGQTGALLATMAALAALFATDVALFLTETALLFRAFAARMAPRIVPVSSSSWSSCWPPRTASPLSTIGYGDITPVTGVARLLVVGEIIVGVVLMLFAFAEIAAYNPEATDREPGER